MELGWEREGGGETVEGVRAQRQKRKVAIPFRRQRGPPEQFVQKDRI